MKIIFPNGSISPEEVVKNLALTGHLGPVVECIIRSREVTRLAREQGIEPTDEDVQQFADSYRAERGLFSSRDALAYLQRQGLTVEDFDEFCRAEVIAKAVKENIASESRLQAYFVNHRSEFDKVALSVITVKREGLAREIVMQVQEDGADFHELARRYSLDEATRLSGGYMGTVARADLPPAIAAKAINTKPGEIIGPFRHGKLFQIFLVEQVYKAVFNNVKEEVRDKLFAEWLAPALKWEVEQDNGACGQAATTNGVS